MIYIRTCYIYDMWYTHYIYVIYDMWYRHDIYDVIYTMIYMMWYIHYIMWYIDDVIYTLYYNMWYRHDIRDVIYTHYIYDTIYTRYVIYTRYTQYIRYEMYTIYTRYMILCDIWYYVIGVWYITGPCFLIDPHKISRVDSLDFLCVRRRAQNSFRERVASQNLVQSRTLDDQPSNDFHYHNAHCVFSVIKTLTIGEFMKVFPLNSLIFWNLPELSQKS